MNKLDYYLSLPWTVQGRWIPEDDGYYLITITEMPGFSVVGATRAEAEQLFSGVLHDYLAAYLESGQQPPVPAAFAAAS